MTQAPSQPTPTPDENDLMARLDGVLPPVLLTLIRGARALGLRRGIATLVIAWLVLLIGVNALYPIDIVGYVLSELFILLYLLPALIAYDQGHDRRFGIAISTLVLGWTLIGWMILLLWALLGERREPLQHTG